MKEVFSIKISFLDQLLWCKFFVFNLWVYSIFSKSLGFFCKIMWIANMIFAKRKGFFAKLSESWA
jgi:hypothetical protein